MHKLLVLPFQYSTHKKTLSAYWDIDQPKRKSPRASYYCRHISDRLLRWGCHNTSLHSTLQFLMRCSFPPSLLRRPRTTFRTFRWTTFDFRQRWLSSKRKILYLHRRGASSSSWVGWGWVVTNWPAARNLFPEQRWAHWQDDGVDAGWRPLTCIKRQSDRQSAVSAGTMGLTRKTNT